MASFFSSKHLPRTDSSIGMLYIKRKQDWVTPAIKAFWKAYNESGYANELNKEEKECPSAE
jgi:hypothetical protein